MGWVGGSPAAGAAKLNLCGRWKGTRYTRTEKTPIVGGLTASMKALVRRMPIARSQSPSQNTITVFQGRAKINYCNSSGNQKD